MAAFLKGSCHRELKVETDYAQNRGMRQESKQDVDNAS
jgi:hypothetical protein